MVDETDLDGEEAGIVHVGRGLGHEPAVLLGVGVVALAHPLPLGLVQLLREVGQVHGGVVRTLKQGVKAVLGAERALLLRKNSE